MDSALQVQQTIDSTPPVQRTMDSTPHVQQTMDSTPHVQQTMDSTPQVQRTMDSTPQVQRTMDSTPHVQRTIDSTPHVQRNMDSTTHVQQTMDSTPQVQRTRDSTPHVQRTMDSTPNVQRSLASTPHVQRTMDSTPQVQRTRDSTPHVQRTMDSTPKVQRSLASTPHVQRTLASTPQVPSLLLVLMFALPSCTSAVLGPAWPTAAVQQFLRMNVMEAMGISNASEGVSSASCLLGADGKAFLLEGSRRKLRASEDVSRQVAVLLHNKSQVTVIVTLKQEPFTSGVLFSIRGVKKRYLEVESSGTKAEVRVQFQSANRSLSQTFSYQMADGTAHRLALTLGPRQIVMHVDCNRIYEYRGKSVDLEIPPDFSLWLGQRHQHHGLFKGVLQDLWIIPSPQGYLFQCPDLNLSCPSCSDFHRMVQNIMDLQGLLARMADKLHGAERRLSATEKCRCERMCDVDGELRYDGDSWERGCKSCTCKNGTVVCERLLCPQPLCMGGSVAVYVPQRCCKECRPTCIFQGQTFLEGGRLTLTKQDSALPCMLYECQAGIMVRVPEHPCPEKMTCPVHQQRTLRSQCCKICPGHDFCAQDHSCGTNAQCQNLAERAVCVCLPGFVPMREDHAYCEDIDECARGSHYCHENTICVNTQGTFHCDCLPGFTRVDDYSCTEHDECQSGTHKCNPNAICTNTVGGHKCTCLPGYVGDGHSCEASCGNGCINGGTCVSPDVCVCPSGFSGRHCQSDIDECIQASIQCHANARCINLPGWFHCECRVGFRDNGSFSHRGQSCIDIDECATEHHGCSNETECVNLPGGFDCRCPRGRRCGGECSFAGKRRRNRHVWTLPGDHCSVCSCQNGKVFCRRTVCECENPNVERSCCPECDGHLAKQCHQPGTARPHRSGEIWLSGCQRCHCLGGRVECQPLACPVLRCPFRVLAEGECCPRCVAEPCHAQPASTNQARMCHDGQGVGHLPGAFWRLDNEPCTLCHCQDGIICCNTDPACTHAP
uniref:protein kinase C-binding protein NELL1 n=1 Tax=Myxine glutinosa TaxID=7769 RepID=UPI00358EF467